VSLAWKCMTTSRRSLILLVTQVYPPDPAAVGQYMAEVAEELVDQGHAVLVLTSDRGYDNHAIRLPRHESRAGVRVWRLPLTSFGKGSLTSRLVGGLSLVGQALVVGLLHRDVRSALLTTSPPLGGAVGVALNAIRGLPFDFWLMDLNPDQAVALGHVPSEAVSVRLFDALNRQILKRARSVLALDGVMAKRFQRKLGSSKAVEVLPLWPLRESRSPTEWGIQTFLAAHECQGKRVIMHAGNHSIAHPLDTLLEAARRIGETTNLRFLFVGGGLGKKSIDRWVQSEAPRHVLSLPYQPIERLGDVLGAATVQVVAVGAETVGIVHPSKLYGALAAGRPILILGPRDCPAAQLVIDSRLGWHVEHGDINGMLSTLAQVATLLDDELAQIANRVHALANAEYSRAELLGRMVKAITHER
ncbi:MAG TPA: glycosyltransferase family 4 protein, partial [Polyangiaceae bacterium]|nr:glycosyltransferase family 4 protein [Polyangiaceae bacterium]